MVRQSSAGDVEAGAGPSRPRYLSTAEFPFESRWITIGGYKVHYVDEGPGDADPVVFIHGNPTWCFHFRRLILGVRDRFRAIAFDHVGMGLSEKPDGGRDRYRLERRIADLEEFFERLGLTGRVTLVMHDWGGMIGMGYAVRHPGRIARLVVLNSAAFGVPAGARLPWQLSLARAPVLGALLVRGLNLFCRGAIRQCVVRRPLSPEVRAAYLSPYGSFSERIAVHRFIQDIPLHPGHPSHSVLEEVRSNLGRLAHLPMLILWGLRDLVFSRIFLAEWRHHFPRADVHEFPDAGHFVLEDCAEEIPPIVCRWLERTASS